jgi:hypothetical protein
MRRTTGALRACFGALACLTAALVGARLWVHQGDVRSIGRDLGDSGLVFEQNEGQLDPSVRFSARTPNGHLLIGDEGPSLVAAGAPDRRLRLHFEGAQNTPVTPGVKVEATANYFLGNDPSRWRTRVPMYRSVEQRGLYPGIDVVYYGRGGRLEYDLVVSPGADLAHLRFQIEGSDRLELQPSGALVAFIGAERVEQRPPTVYQVDGSGERIEVAAAYLLEGELATLTLGAYDRDKPLVIDPVVVFATYLGGSADDVLRSVRVDPLGNIYVIGTSQSTNFPTVGALRGAGGGTDVVISKLDALTHALVFSTYLGGSGDEDVKWSLDLDPTGNVYVVGQTGSVNFPTVAPLQAMLKGPTDVFVAELNPTGSALVFSTYFGGSGDEFATGVEVDATGAIYGGGLTTSSDFPTTNSVQPTSGGGGDGMVFKLTPAKAVAYASYLGGAGSDEVHSITVDATGQLYATGLTQSTNFPVTVGAFRIASAGAMDVFVSKLDAAGSALVYSTYYGGTADERGNSIAVNAAGEAFVTGQSFSIDLPTVSAFQPGFRGIQDTFVIRLNSSGSALVYATYYGGSGDENGEHIVLDSSDVAYITGMTTSANLPLAGAWQTSFGGGNDAFVAALASNGSSLVLSSYLGGSSTEFGYSLARDGSGNLYAVGFSASANFPTVSPLQPKDGGNDGFIAMIGSVNPSLTTVTPSSGPTAGGTPVVITGTNFVLGTRVAFGGVAASSVTVSDTTRLTAVTPSHSAGTVEVSLTRPGQSSISSPGSFSFEQARLVISSSPITTAAGVCAGPITLQLLDLAGAPLNGSPTTIAVGSSSQSLQLYASTDCAGPPIGSVSLSSAGSTVAVYFSDATPGTPAVTADAANVSGTSQTQTVLRAPAYAVGCGCEGAAAGPGMAWLLVGCALRRRHPRSSKPAGRGARVGT